MHYIEVYFCQQSEFGDSADASIKHMCVLYYKYAIIAFYTTPKFGKIIYNITGLMG